MVYEHIRLEISDRVARVTLDRPGVRNAMDGRTLEELADCFASLGRKGERAAVLSGEGPDFCAGADIRWMREGALAGPARNRRDARALLAMCRAVYECPVPVVASVHGSVYGGGLGLVAASDIVLAQSSSRFCFSECRLGIIPAVVSTFVLPKIGAQARRYYLTAEPFDAAKARSLGLVHEVAAPEEAGGKLDALLECILRNGPRAVRAAKAYVRAMEGLSFEKRLAFSVKTLSRLRAAPEAKEGLAAFLEKRPPAWS